MYGLIGKMTAVPGKREELLWILLGGIGEMPGCLSYVVARDPGQCRCHLDHRSLGQRSQSQGSLSLSAVQTSIKSAMPLIATFNEHIRTEPVGGHGFKTLK